MVGKDRGNGVHLLGGFHAARPTDDMETPIEVHATDGKPDVESFSRVIQRHRLFVLPLRASRLRQLFSLATGAKVADMNWADAGAFLALGLAAGTYGALIGVGGGVLVVPVLLLWQHVAPKDAAGTSMAVVLANAVSGSATFLRQHRVDTRSGIVFALAGIPGAVLGGVADQIVAPRMFSLLFAAFLILVGLRLLVYPGQSTSTGPAIADAMTTRGFRMLPAIFIGLGAGFVASLFGVGGGIIYVPTMVYLFAYPAHVATATSTFIIALTAIVATATHAAYHDVLWVPAAWLALGAVGGAQIGARLAPRVRAAGLLRLFALAVLIAAGWLCYKALHTSAVG